MSLNKAKSLNRAINQEPDPKNLAAINEIFSEYLISSKKPLDQLGFEFSEYFKNERIISFRQKFPKSLTQKGDAILQLSKLWILYMFVMQLDKKPFKEILATFREGFSTVKQKEELLEGLTMLLEKFPDIEITPEDENELERLFGPKTPKNNRDVIAMSDCKLFALVKLSPDQQKRLKSSTAIIPVKSNPWVESYEIDAYYSFDKLLSMSNYTYCYKY